MFEELGIGGREAPVSPRLPWSSIQADRLNLAWASSPSQAMVSCISGLLRLLGSSVSESLDPPLDNPRSYQHFRSSAFQMTSYFPNWFVRPVKESDTKDPFTPWPRTAIMSP